MGPLPHSMARHGRRRRRFNLRKVRNSAFIAIGALAAGDVIVSAFTATSTNPYRIMSIDTTWSLSELGAAIDDAQEFGVSHSNYTAAEVEQCLEANAAIDIGAKVEQEQANRLVRQIGVFTGSGGVGSGLQFNDGRPVKTRLNWHIGIGNTLNVWVRNATGVVYTTGASVNFTGVVWVKDAV